MRISAQEEYGFRCLLRMAAHQEERPLTGPEIASAEGISGPYANRVLHSLKKQGLVKTTRGARGGYHLSRKTDEISMADIIKNLDGFLFQSEYCQWFKGQKEHCVRHKKPCNMRMVWTTISRHLELALRDITLKDLLEENGAQISRLVKKNLRR